MNLHEYLYAHNYEENQKLVVYDYNTAELLHNGTVNGIDFDLLGKKITGAQVQPDLVSIWVINSFVKIGMGHMIKAMQDHGFGQHEIMSMRKAMMGNCFDTISFVSDTYTEDW